MITQTFPRVDKFNQKKKPPRVGIDAFEIPPELPEIDRWVCWRWDWRDNKWTKPPLQTDGDFAKNNDPKTWTTFSQAMDGFRKLRDFSGVGFVFTDDDNVVGVDIDNCILPDGSLDDRGQQAMQCFGDSYGEISPSGTGLKFLIRGHVPGGKAGRKNPKLDVELYGSGRYFTLTGRRVTSGRQIIDCQAKLNQWCESVFDSPKPPKSGPKITVDAISTESLLTVQDIVNKAAQASNGAKFQRLWAGDTSDHGDDDSAADLALCSLLAFWCAGNANLMDQCFRQSGLFRDKWNREDYRAQTIQKATDGCSEFYSASGSATDSKSRTPEPWPDLISFDAPDLLSIDTNVLPDSIGRMVQQVSEATETPPEMSLMVALGAIATATMRKWDVRIDADFRQPLNLYLSCVMPPGNRKSAVFRRLFHPVHEYEKQIRQAAEPEFLRTSSDREIWERQCTDLKTRISKSDGDESIDMRRELDHLLCNAPAVFHKPQLVSDDVTPESVCSLLDQNHERLGIASAEPEVFDLILGRYSKGPNLGLWLKGHDGDHHTENRRNRPNPIVLDSPLLTLTIMAQPEAIQAAGSHSVMRGRGMLDRFLFLYPPSPVGMRACVSGKVDPLIERQYAECLTALLSTDIPLDGFGGPEPLLLTLSPDAHSLWKAEQIRVERRMADNEPLSTIAGWGSKYAAQVARIAANLHLMEHVNRQSVIAAQSMQQAIHIGHVVESHSRAVFQAMGTNAEMQTAQRVVRKVAAEKLTELSRRDVMRIDRTVDVKDAQAAIDLMVDHGYLVAQHGEKRRGRPSDRYLVNPAVFSL